MLIAKLDGSVVGEHQQLFPHTGFPEAGPSDAWLEKNGFVRVPKSAEELAAEARSERNRLLSETDWVVIMHTEQGTNIPAVWELYRQALRDITSQGEFPYTIEWPTKPGE